MPLCIHGKCARIGFSVNIIPFIFVQMKSIEEHSEDFKRIAAALEYIRINFKKQPTLDDVAAAVHLSPFHFQRLFTDWAGISPKKFLQYTTLNYAKSLLRQKQTTLFETADASGLSGTGRLHDLFINIEGMTPAEYRNGGESLKIIYDFFHTRYGEVMAAATEKGVCYVAFIDDRDTGFDKLKMNFPKAAFENKADILLDEIVAHINNDDTQKNKLSLHVKGTPFQLKVWEALIKIGPGELTTYGNIASGINAAAACRAVGTAIAGNPIAFIIPCHRVIRSSGEFGGYMWGPNRKVAMIGYEAGVLDRK